MADAGHTADASDARPAQGQPATDTFRTDLLALLPHLRAFARGLAGRPEQADDLVQEAVIRAWAARDSYVPGSNMRAWTFTIMRNHFLNEVRKNSRQTELDDRTAETMLITGATQENDLHLRDLQRALDKLPPNRREALLLIGAGGFGYVEAAAICGVPLGTMKSRVARGRNQLHRLLDDLAEADAARQQDG